MVIKWPANQITPWLHALFTNHTHKDRFHISGIGIDRSLSPPPLSKSLPLSAVICA